MTIGCDLVEDNEEEATHGDGALGLEEGAQLGDQLVADEPLHVFGKLDQNGGHRQRHCAQGVMVLGRLRDDEGTDRTQICQKRFGYPENYGSTETITGLSVEK